MTHQRLDFANALEKVRLRICHTVLMNLYLGGFQCVHSFSKHRRKYAGHVSEKGKRILSLTIVESRCAAGPDLLPLCFDWVSRSCQHTFKSKSFSVAYMFLDRPQNKTYISRRNSVSYYHYFSKSEEEMANAFVE